MQRKSFGLQGKADCAEHADNTENGGGKSDKQMARAMDQDIDEVGHGCGKKHGQKTDTIAGQVEKTM